jgi:hypothetical protein
MCSGLLFVSIAEVVGSNNPTHSTFIIVVNYGIELSLFFGPLGLAYYIRNSTEVCIQKID